MFIRKGFHHVFMDQAGTGEGGGAGSSSDGGPENNGVGGSGAEGSTSGEQGSAASGGQVAGTNAGSDAGTAAQGSVLQQGGQGQAPSIPEKYQVKKEDGSLDIEASSLKLAEAYGNLEKRIGTGDLPPKTAEEYEIAVPDELKDSWNPKEDPLLGDFLKKAHAAGFTQKQIDLAMSQYMEVVPDLVNGARQLSSEDCTAELKAEWKTDAQYKAEVNKAYKAAVAYGDKDAESIIRDYGNDPRIVRFMARVGNELGEDASFNAPGGIPSGGQSVEAMLTSEAYTNAKHPDHARVSAQVQKHFEKQAAALEKTGGTPVL